MVNGMDGDMMDMMRRVFDLVLRQQNQLNGVEVKIENLQSQMSELSRKLDIFTTQVLGSRTQSGPESIETRPVQNLDSFERYGSYRSCQTSFLGMQNSVPDSIESGEKLSEIKAKRAEVVPSRTRELTDSSLLADEKGDGITSVDRRLSGDPVPADLPSDQVDEGPGQDNFSATATELRANNNDEHEVKSAINGSGPISVSAEAMSANTKRITRLNFGQGMLQTRPVSPLPSTPRSSGFLDSQLKKRGIGNAVDNRKTYLEESLRLSEPDTEPSSLSMPSDDDHNLTEGQGYGNNNQMTAPSGFKNEHGDEDNRSQKLPNLKLLKEGPTHPSDDSTAMEDDISKEVKNGAAGMNEDEAQKSDIQDVTHDTSGVMSDDVIHGLIETERLAAKDCEDLKSEGVDTVICLDTSGSMAGNTLKQAIQAIKSLVNGIEKNTIEHELEENIALVTFGHENKIQCHLTNDYGTIRDKLETLSAGGPSPLWLGLALALTEIKERGGLCNMEHLTVMPRIILITDGFATQKNQLTGTELTTVDTDACSEVLTLYQMCKAICSCVDCIVPGTCNEALLKVLCDNRLFGMQDSQLAYLSEFFLVRDLVNQKLEKVSTGELSRTFFETIVDNTKLTKQGKADMLALLNEISTETEVSSTEVAMETVEKSSQQLAVGQQATQPKPEPVVETPATTQQQFEPQRQTVSETKPVSEPEPKPELDTKSEPQAKPQPKPRSKPRTEPHPETLIEEQPPSIAVSSTDSQGSLSNDELDESMIPSFGAKVVANPTWEDYQSKRNLIGTVIAARKNGHIKTLWSDGTVEKCRFGVSGQFDIRMVAPEELPEEDKLQIGSQVERGKDWRWKDQDGGIGNFGVVLKIDGAVVHVIWPHGGQGNYRYGYNKKFDLKVVPAAKLTMDSPNKYYAWHIKDLSEKWHMLPKDASDRIEEMYNAKETKTFTITIQFKQFTVSVDKMFAREVETQTKYDIERKEIPQSEWQNLNQQ